MSRLGWNSFPGMGWLSNSNPKTGISKSIAKSQSVLPSSFVMTPMIELLISVP